eukprot:g10511.t1
MGFWCCVGDWLAVLQGMTPTQAAYFSACLVSAMSFIGVLTIGLLQIESIKGPVEYLSLCFAGTALAADALMHLLPEAYVAGGTAFPLRLVASYFAVELVHNFVDGIAIGIAWTSSKNSVSAGLNTTIAVIVHEIPQELGDFMVLRLAGFPVRRLLFVNFLVSLSTILGVFCSTYLISSEQTTATVKKTLMALTAGSFLSLSLYLIFPQVKESIETHHKEKGKRKKPFLACFLTSLIALWMVYQVGDNQKLQSQKIQNRETIRDSRLKTFWKARIDDCNTGERAERLHVNNHRDTLESTRAFHVNRNSMHTWRHTTAVNFRANAYRQKQERFEAQAIKKMNQTDSFIKR